MTRCEATKRRRNCAAGLGVALALLLGCFGHNYLEHDPRYADAAPPVSPSSADTLRIVSFNIAFAQQIDSAIAAIRGTPETRNADVLLLQEMDAPGTERIARALSAGYVYYPATKHFKTRRDFGNAVVSRWPIVEDEKLLLPHPSRYSNTVRTATAATLQVGARRVRVYSAHLGTPQDVSASQRREQLQAIMVDARKYQRVIIGGDMNSSSIGNFAIENGYQWPTREGPRTLRLGRWDMIFTRGVEAPPNETGTVSNAHRASDHLPIWATAILY